MLKFKKLSPNTTKIKISENHDHHLSKYLKNHVKGKCICRYFGKSIPPKNIEYSLY
jgi:hypothetical protein